MTATLLLIALSGPVHAYPVSGVPMSFEPIIRRYSDAYAVPLWLCMAVAREESSFRPSVQAKGRGGAVSRGLFQINARFEADLAWRAGVESFDWRNPDHSAHVGIAYLSRLIKKYHGDLRLAVASFNWGPGNVSRGGAWPQETINYVRKVLG